MTKMTKMTKKWWRQHTVIYSIYTIRLIYNEHEVISMSYLKTNLRLTANELGPTALGGGLNNFLDGGSTGGPPGVAEGRAGQFFGGVVMWSMNEQQSGLISITTESILGRAYGVTMVSNLMLNASGYKVVPINIMPISLMSTQKQYFPLFSYGTGSVVFIQALATSLSGAGSTLIYTLIGTSVSQHILCVGLIASAPYGPWA